MTEIAEPVSGATKAAMFLMGVGGQGAANSLRNLMFASVRQLQREGSIVISRGGADEYVV